VTVLRVILGLKNPFVIKQFRRVGCIVLNLQLDGTSNGYIESGKPNWNGARHEPDLQQRTAGSGLC
jgi:hypothetical protein